MSYKYIFPRVIANCSGRAIQRVDKWHLVHITFSRQMGSWLIDCEWDSCRLTKATFLDTYSNCNWNLCRSRHSTWWEARVRPRRPHALVHQLAQEQVPEESPSLQEWSEKFVVWSRNRMWEFGIERQPGGAVQQLQIIGSAQVICTIESVLPLISSMELFDLRFS